MSKIKDECKKEELNKILQEELLDAKLDYDQAFKMFNCAETDFVEIAIDNLHAAEIRLNSAIKRVKLLYQEINNESNREFKKIKKRNSECRNN